MCFWKMIWAIAMYCPPGKQTCHHDSRTMQIFQPTISCTCRNLLQIWVCHSWRAIILPTTSLYHVVGKTPSSSLAPHGNRDTPSSFPNIGYLPQLRSQTSGTSSTNAAVVFLQRWVPTQMGVVLSAAHWMATISTLLKTKKGHQQPSFQDVFLWFLEGWKLTAEHCGIYDPTFHGVLQGHPTSFSSHSIEIALLKSPFWVVGESPGFPPATNTRQNATERNNAILLIWTTPGSNEHFLNTRLWLPLTTIEFIWHIHRLFTFPGIHLAFTKQQPLQQARCPIPPVPGVDSVPVPWGKIKRRQLNLVTCTPTGNQRQLPARLSWMEVLVWMENHRTSSN